MSSYNTTHTQRFILNLEYSRSHRKSIVFLDIGTKVEYLFQHQKYLSRKMFSSGTLVSTVCAVLSTLLQLSHFIDDTLTDISVSR